MCNNPATYCCSSCHCNNLYCSKLCQIADWKLHKVLCKDRLLFEVPPTPSSRRAIVFLVSGEIKFAWETTEMKTDEDDGTQWESPVGLAEKYFGGEHQRPQIYYSNVLRGRKLKECITLHLNDNFLIDGSPKNLAVCKVVPEMNNGGAVWGSPLVAMKRTNSWYDEGRLFSQSNPGVGHMDMGDLREVVDYLTTWKRIQM